MMRFTLPRGSDAVFPHLLLRNVAVACEFDGLPGGPPRDFADDAGTGQ
jgi:hypothetical protein